MGWNTTPAQMGDDVPYLHPNGLVEIPGQWLLEDWEQFAFNADPAWGFVPENCAKVYDLWWQEFQAMHDFGCCFVLTLHPWLSGRPSRVRLLEDLVRAMQADGRRLVCARARDRRVCARAPGGAPRDRLRFAFTVTPLSTAGARRLAAGSARQPHS